MRPMASHTHTEGVMLEYLKCHLAHRTVALCVVLRVSDIHNISTVATRRVYDEQVPGPGLFNVLYLKEHLTPLTPLLNCLGLVIHTVAVQMIPHTRLDIATL